MKKNFFSWIWSKKRLDFLFFCRNPRSGKNQVLEIWTKMLSIKLQDSLSVKYQEVRDWADVLHKINKVSCKLILSFFVGLASHAQSTHNSKFVILCYISRKKWEIKLIFCLHINIKISCTESCYKWRYNLVGAAMYIQSTQTNL